MEEKQYTFEEIDRHIQSANLADLEAKAAAATPANALPNVCAIYRAIRPILVILSNLPLIPQAWRNALKTFIRLMDGLCPGS